MSSILEIASEMLNGALQLFQATACHFVSYGSSGINFRVHSSDICGKREVNVTCKTWYKIWLKSIMSKNDRKELRTSTHGALMLYNCSATWKLCPREMQWQSKGRGKMERTLYLVLELNPCGILKPGRGFAFHGSGMAQAGGVEDP